MITGEDFDGSKANNNFSQYVMPIINSATSFIPGGAIETYLMSNIISETGNAYND
jgi:hypothetical protein